MYASECKKMPCHIRKNRARINKSENSSNRKLDIVNSFLTKTAHDAMNHWVIFSTLLFSFPFRDHFFQPDTKTWKITVFLTVLFFFIKILRDLLDTWI